MGSFKEEPSLGFYEIDSQSASKSVQLPLGLRMSCAIWMPEFSSLFQKNTDKWAGSVSAW